MLRWSGMSSRWCYVGLIWAQDVLSRLSSVIIRCKAGWGQLELTFDLLFKDILLSQSMFLLLPFIFILWPLALTISAVFGSYSGISFSFSKASNPASNDFLFCKEFHEKFSCSCFDEKFRSLGFRWNIQSSEERTELRSSLERKLSYNLEHRHHHHHQQDHH